MRNGAHALSRPQNASAKSWQAWAALGPVSTAASCAPAPEQLPHAGSPSASPAISKPRAPPGMSRQLQLCGFGSVHTLLTQMAGAVHVAMFEPQAAPSAATAPHVPWVVAVSPLHVAPLEQSVYVLAEAE